MLNLRKGKEGEEDKFRDREGSSLLTWREINSIFEFPEKENGYIDFGNKYPELEDENFEKWLIEANERSNELLKDN